MSMEFNIRGLEVFAKLQKDLKDLPRVLTSTWQHAAEITVQYTKSKIVSGDAKSPSAPGEYPHSVTGALRDSIEAQVKGVTGFEIGANVPYGEFLEYGTSKMAARPFIQPSIEANYATIIKLLNTNIAKSFNNL